MDIQHIDKQRLTSNQQSDAQYFKKGSIVRGKILKLFPQNKAHIQLGAHTFIAQLEAPLQLGASYHFQVQSAEDVLRSEERRVGKECRSWWWTDHGNKSKERV